MHFASRQKPQRRDLILRANGEKKEDKAFIGLRSPSSCRSCPASCCSSGLRGLRARRPLVRLRPSWLSTRCT